MISTESWYSFCARANRPFCKTAPAVWTNIKQYILNAVVTECAFIGTDIGEGGLRC